ncbi:MAG TPA: RNA polymerase sigma factor [Candidatus Angelobacter sp.]|nr:RNA polymerase sigma factor [Candidatus Angelobacter sp.]
MAGQAILEQTILKCAMPTEATACTVESLVQDHARMVFRIAYSILRNHADAEDAVQECFLRVVKHQQRLHKIRNAKTWLARVAWTTALDKRRATGKAVLLHEDESDIRTIDTISDAGPAADEQLVHRQMQLQLQRLIASLPDELREPLELSTVQELNSAEIAEVMDIPESSVRTRLFRARRLLKEKLASLVEVGKNG